MPKHLSVVACGNVWAKGTLLAIGTGQRGFGMTNFPDDLEAALTTHARQQNISRDEAIQRIVREWMRTHGFLDNMDEAAPPVPGKPDPEFVQYPGYFKGDGSL
ncbi:hypothetical protein ASG03_19930 [Rhizobium sp. Leaf341]|nr:hypothetical protein ASG03_19930 [Rhizobium sp. Leaf341]